MNLLSLHNRGPTASGRSTAGGGRGGVVLHQNNTWPIMAAGCHVVMTASAVLKEDDI